MLRILLIDDNLNDRLLAIHVLEQEFFDLQFQEIVQAKDLEEALETGQFDLVITDYQLRWSDGLTAIRAIKNRYPDCPVIMFTNSGTQEIAVEAMKSGLEDYIIKSPKHYVRLPAAVRRAIERTEAQRKAVRLESRLQTLLNNLNVGIYRLTADGTLLEGNPAFLRLLGLNSLTEIPASQTLEPYFQPLDYAQVLNQLKQNSEIRDREMQLRRANGTLIWVRISTTFTQVDGTTVIDGLIEDISERKQAQKALHQSEERAQLAINISRLGTWHYDPSTNLVELDKRMREIWGEPDDTALIPLPMVIERIHPDDRERVVNTISNALNPMSSGTYEIDYRIVWRDGTERWLFANGQVQSEGEGVSKQAVRFLGTALDITERKRAEERLHLLYETTSDLLATEHPMQLMNNLFNKLSAQLELHSYYNYMVEEKDNQLMLHLNNYEGISEGTAQSLEWIEFGQYLCGLVAQERQQIVFDQAQISTHPNAQLVSSMGITACAGQPLIVQGRLLGTLSFASRTRTSFTPEEIDLLQSTCEQMAIAIERANLLASIQQQAQQLQQANRIKDEFLAVLSHELRSPLNPILGWSKLLQISKLDEAKTAYALSAIERNAKLQSELIEDLLDVSRILQGKLSLQVCPVDLVSMVQAAMETVRLAAESKSIQIQARFEPNVGQVLGDPNRLQQVIWNLLSNAIKFTDIGGRVEIHLKQVSSFAEVTVIDTGQGIHPNFLPYVFEYFRQADSATTRKFGGLGLGLAIVRHLVELHGGTVRVESAGEDQGTTFTVRLPLMATPSQKKTDSKPSEPSLNLHGIKVLVVDDNTDTREFIAFMLEMYGANVTTVTSAVEALDTLTKSRADVLLSDIGMPEMDGYMLVRQLRALPYQQGGKIPAIALTAFAGEINYQKAIEAGFQRHVPKPIDPANLVETITDLVKQSQ
ncbi:MULTISPECIES: response regulator [unclassified Nostoc]|uniref:response regulator n=1 Tax=unclassified Nostoc TaxID=2593658 RepID=UPI002AD225BF|nr:response regulator [Nostoc sp. DedQUE03]MDZ7976354.1 response regulator [Nostoc sp. DedQUE03]MDZ8047968.1 response regulator [Nostoc sp. DedQUE02]